MAALEIRYAEKPEVLPASKEKIEGLFLLDIALNGAVFPCVFDTGASISVFSETVARRANAALLDERVMGGGNAGNPGEARLAMVERLAFGGTAVVGLTVAVVPDEALCFAMDDGADPVRVNGFLGWDVISRFAWRYDASKSAFCVEKPQRRADAGNMDDWGNMPIVHAACMGEDRLFGLDTGNTETVIGGALYPLFGGAKEKPDTFVGMDGAREEVVRLIDTLAIEIKGKRVRLQNVSAVNRPVFPTENKNVCGLLGADILRGASWAIDYENRRFEI